MNLGLTDFIWRFYNESSIIKKVLYITLFFLTKVLFAQQSYYNDVDLSLSGIELRNELITKITSTQKKGSKLSLDKINISKYSKVTPLNNTKKGDVARSIMYKYLCYGNAYLPSKIIEGTVNKIDKNMVNILLEWNAEDPVSQEEDDKNNLAKKNRNPFIDNPNLATQIWGGPEAENRWSTKGLENNLFTKILTYPNPVINGKVIITFPDNLEVTNVEVFSVLGKRVYQRKNPKILENKITIRKLKTGVYLLKLSNDSNSITRKLVVH